VLRHAELTYLRVGPVVLDTPVEGAYCYYQEVHKEVVVLTSRSQVLPPAVSYLVVQYADVLPPLAFSLKDGRKRSS
jgi:hypothetical protein